ncbi:MAG: hypothetical protein ACREN4_00545 [Candidatus Dormibacteria bacterium]
MAEPRGPAGHRHPHRTWLYLLPEDPQVVASPASLGAAGRALLEAGLASPSDRTDELAPGPAWGALLEPGEAPSPDSCIRLDAGVLRAYPDPGPEGFESQPLNDYRAACPACGGGLLLFTLAFRDPDPMRGSCPRCEGTVDISTTHWDPPLVIARTEVSLGPFGSRPRLAGQPAFGALERALGCRLREVHVSL